MNEEAATTKRYEVELSVDCRAWVEVDAEDEDEAHDLAKVAFYEQNNVGDLDVDAVRVETITPARTT